MFAITASVRHAQKTTRSSAETKKLQGRRRKQQCDTAATVFGVAPDLSKAATTQEKGVQSCKSIYPFIHFYRFICVEILLTSFELIIDTMPQSKKAQLRELKVKVDQIKSKIERFKTFLNTETQNIIELTKRFETIEPLLEEFDKLQDMIHR